MLLHPGTEQRLQLRPGLVVFFIFLMIDFRRILELVIITEASQGMSSSLMSFLLTRIFRRHFKLEPKYEHPETLQFTRWWWLRLGGLPKVFLVTSFLLPTFATAKKINSLLKKPDFFFNIQIHHSRFPIYITVPNYLFILMARIFFLACVIGFQSKHKNSSTLRTILKSVTSV